MGESLCGFPEGKFRGELLRETPAWNSVGSDAESSVGSLFRAAVDKNYIGASSSSRSSDIPSLAFFQPRRDGTKRKARWFDWLPSCIAHGLARKVGFFSLLSSLGSILFMLFLSNKLRASNVSECGTSDQTSKRSEVDSARRREARCKLPNLA